MRNIDKISHIDGLPGITLPGVTGQTGNRGACSVALDPLEENGQITIEGIGSFNANIPDYVPMADDMFIVRYPGVTKTYIVDSVDGSICKCTPIGEVTVDNDTDSDIVVEITGITIPYIGWDGKTVKPSVQNK